MPDDDRISVEELLSEMTPEGRLHFENAQLRVTVKRLTTELAELRNQQAPTAGQH